MDLVYILGTETAWNNNELKYSLRSVDKQLSGIDRIFIIGSEPEFISFDYSITGQKLCDKNNTPLIWLCHYDDMELTKERRIMEKVKFACKQIALSEDFFFMNDDMFLLNSINAIELPNYYKGTLLNSAKKRQHDRYYNALMNCHNALTDAKCEQLNNYDTHSPIIYNKSKFMDVMSKYNWDVRYGYVVKSLYANTLNLEGTFQPDCKIDEPMSQSRIKDKIIGRPFFSIGDNGLNYSMKEVLQELFPIPSKWEK